MPINLVWRTITVCDCVKLRCLSCCLAIVLLPLVAFQFCLTCHKSMENLWPNCILFACGSSHKKRSSNSRGNWICGRVCCNGVTSLWTKLISFRSQFTAMKFAMHALVCATKSMQKFQIQTINTSSFRKVSSLTISCNSGTILARVIKFVTMITCCLYLLCMKFDKDLYTICLDNCKVLLFLV